MTLDTNEDITNWSELEVVFNRGKSRPVTSRSVAPLKLLHPEGPDGICYTVLSSYGGGLVQGDQIQFRITSRENTTLYLATQANTRIYKSPDFGPSEQVLEGTLEPGALVVVNPDPVVPHEASAFRQTQVWNLANSSNLVLVDWLSSGRDARGESFSFNSFFSEVDIRLDHRSLLLDRFSSEPEQQEPTAPARFGPYRMMLNIYIYGTRLQSLVEEWARTCTNPEVGQIKDIREQAASPSPPACLYSVNPLDDGLSVIRALGIQRSDLQPLLDRLFVDLADSSRLGFNPMLRKY